MSSNKPNQGNPSLAPEPELHSLFNRFVSYPSIYLPSIAFFTHTGDGNFHFPPSLLLCSFFFNPLYVCAFSVCAFSAFYLSIICKAIVCKARMHANYKANKRASFAKRDVQDAGRKRFGGLGGRGWNVK